MFYVASNDSFSTWSPPVEITKMLPYAQFSAGPGEGVQTKSGRMIVCGWGNPTDDKKPPGSSSSLLHCLVL